MGRRLGIILAIIGPLVAILTFPIFWRGEVRVAPEGISARLGLRPNLTVRFADLKEIRIIAEVGYRGLVSTYFNFDRKDGGSDKLCVDAGPAKRAADLILRRAAEKEVVIRDNTGRYDQAITQLNNVLKKKDQRGVQKYEEAAVKEAHGEPGADALYEEAIAIWEEVLAKSTASEYKKFAVARLASAYLVLGDLQRRQGNIPEAKAAFRKAIEHGEQAVQLRPQGPLIRHQLKRARQLLHDLRERERGKETS
jgi:tetratricopeptide (TPR) repeat protein